MANEENKKAQRFDKPSPEVAWLWWGTTADEKLSYLVGFLNGGPEASLLAVKGKDTIPLMQIPVEIHIEENPQSVALTWVPLRTPGLVPRRADSKKKGFFG